MYYLTGALCPAGPACHYPMVNSTGVGWVRNELAWSAIETVKGEYNFSLGTPFFDMGPLDYDGFTLGMKQVGEPMLHCL